ncbi:putative hypoxanthine phosphoribosyltransferase [Onchocerca flexuosa]|uniref:Putative hypoxanthine phosphoribosyltransferase n=1 Tax=Onchocerca flexuosa TaxID=387005 RepID=A0A238BLP3_9BILA|nr:putative hypoxanthine phosphoribosyltransferase [Onchocerca flexuosa]
MGKDSNSTRISIPDDAEFKLESFILPKCYYGDLKSVLIPKGLICDRIKCLAQEIFQTIGDKSYTNVKRSDTLEIIGLLNTKQLENKNVVIVEDIVDSGVTMVQLLKTLDEMKVKQKWTAILLSKRCKRKFEVSDLYFIVQEDFVAFDIPDKFVVGFGLDYNQKYRDLGHICIMSDAGIEKYKVTE